MVQVHGDAKDAAVVAGCAAVRVERVAEESDEPRVVGCAGGDGMGGQGVEGGCVVGELGGCEGVGEEAEEEGCLCVWLVTYTEDD